MFYTVTCFLCSVFLLHSQFSLEIALCLVSRFPSSEIAIGIMDNVLNPRQGSPERDQDSSDYQVTTSYYEEHSGTDSVPRIAVHPPSGFDQQDYSSSKDKRDTMSSSTHRSSGSSSRRSSKTKSKKDDWSDITDPEERRRVQNKLAQRKFRMSSSTIMLGLKYDTVC